MCELCPPGSNVLVSVKHLKEAHGCTYNRYRRMGYKLNPGGQPPRMYGPDHPNWKGGHIDGNGYKVISRRGRTNLLEHRVVAAEKLGRPLLPGEIVHHIDGNRLNNHPDNLVVMTKQEHDNTPREGLRRRYVTGIDCERAVHVLHSLGWTNAAIARALRIGPDIVARWLKRPTP